jgi:hypothetical protein
MLLCIHKQTVKVVRLEYIPYVPIFSLQLQLT